MFHLAFEIKFLTFALVDGGVDGIGIELKGIQLDLQELD